MLVLSLNIIVQTDRTGPPDLLGPAKVTWSKATVKSLHILNKEGKHLF